MVSLSLLLTDQGADFTSKLLKEVSNLFKIKQIQTTAYHPQSNGALERSHATLADYLKHFINDKQTDWDDWINFAMFTYNTTPHTSTKFTPFELIFGEKASLPTAIIQPAELKYTYDDFIDNLKFKLNKSREIARENLIENKSKSKATYDKKLGNPIQYQINDLIYLRNEQFKGGHSRKLTPKFNGPYKIVTVNSRTNVTIKIGKKKR